jgi:hypothetical protein
MMRRVLFVFSLFMLVAAFGGVAYGQSLLRVECSFNNAISFSDGNFTVYENGATSAAAPVPKANDGDQLASWPGWAVVTETSAFAFEGMTLGQIEQFNVVQICGSGFIPNAPANPAPEFADSAAVKAKIAAALQAGVSFYGYTVCEDTSFWPGTVETLCDGGSEGPFTIPASALNHPIITYANPDISDADLSFGGSWNSFGAISPEYQVIAIQFIGEAPVPAEPGDPVMIASEAFGCGHIFLSTYNFLDGGSEPAQRFIDSLAHYLLDVSCAAQDVALDPAGRFVVYAGFDAECSKNGLLYLPLDSAGNAAGPSTELIDCDVTTGDVTGLDILREGASDLYWIILGGSDPTDGKFLLQINSAGGVIKPPHSIVPAVQFGSTKGASAIAARGSTKFNVWIAGQGGSIYRAIIVKSTLGLNSIKKTALKAASNASLQVSQKTNGNPDFLGFLQPAKILKGFAVYSSGLPVGTSWRLSTRNDLGSELGGVTSDGLMSICNDFNPALDQLYDQMLRSTGIPNSSTPEVVSQSIFRAIRSADAGNPLATGRRFIVFLLDDGKLYLRKVNATTGIVMGATVALN